MGYVRKLTRELIKKDTLITCNNKNTTTYIKYMLTLTLQAN